MYIQLDGGCMFRDLDITATMYKPLIEGGKKRVYKSEEGTERDRQKKIEE